MAPPIKCRCNKKGCTTCYAREWARRAYRLRAYGQWSPWGDLDVVRAHLDNLRAHKVGVKSIAAASGVGRSTVGDILTGRKKKVSAEIAGRLLAVQPDAALRRSPTTSVRRLRALAALGYSTYDLADRLGSTQATIWRLVAGRNSWVTPDTERRVRDLYDELSMTPGPSEEVRSWAREKGYAPPLAWDDIDDLEASPAALPRRDRMATPVKRKEATRADTVVCRRCGIRQRAGGHVTDLCPDCRDVECAA